MPRYNSDTLMIEAFLDGELEEGDLSKVTDLINTRPELKQLYTLLKAQKESIKHSFFLGKKLH